jgi:hypothetical protein
MPKTSIMLTIIVPMMYQPQNIRGRLVIECLSACS